MRLPLFKVAVSGNLAFRQVWRSALNRARAEIPSRSFLTVVSLTENSGQVHAVYRTER